MVELQTIGLWKLCRASGPGFTAAAFAVLDGSSVLKLSWDWRRSKAPEVWRTPGRWRDFSKLQRMNLRGGFDRGLGHAGRGGCGDGAPLLHSNKAT